MSYFRDIFFSDTCCLRLLLKTSFLRFWQSLSVHHSLPFFQSFSLHFDPFLGMFSLSPLKFVSIWKNALSLQKSVHFQLTAIVCLKQSHSLQNARNHLWLIHVVFVNFSFLNTSLIDLFLKANVNPMCSRLEKINVITNCKNNLQMACIN